MSDTIAVTLGIDNVYELYGTIKTIVETEIDPPPPEDDETYEDWLQDHIFEHTGTGRTDGDAGYFVEVLQSSDPDALPPGTKYEFC